MRWKFVGKFSDLTALGFTFQYLYDNKMAWHYDELFVFRSGKYMSMNSCSMSKRAKEMLKVLHDRKMIEGSDYL